MKKCISCEVEKPYEEFGKLSRSKDGYNPKCKSCKREYDNKHHANRSKENKERKYKLQVERINKARDFMINYLKDKKCKTCPEDRMAALDFHHLRDKKFNVGDGVRLGYSIERIKKEIEKCEILCANCHRVHTAEDLGWYSK